MAARSAVRTAKRPLAGHADVSPITRGDGALAVYQQLRERIVRGRLAPGSRLVEREVAARLGVSRTPVRAALERLRQEGYIVATGSALLARATVAPLTNDDAREIHMIVAQIEGLAAREAAGKPKAVRMTMTRDMRQLNTQFFRAAQVRLPDSTGCTTSMMRFISATWTSVPARGCACSTMRSSRRPNGTDASTRAHSSAR